MNLFGQSARFVLFSTCRSVNVTSVVIVWLFLSASFATPLCLTTVHVASYVLLRYISGFIVYWLHTPPPIPCHMKFVKRRFTERAAFVGVPVTLVEGLLCNSELAMLWTDTFRLSTVMNSFCLVPIFVFLSFCTYFLSSTPNIGLSRLWSLRYTDITLNYSATIVNRQLV
jgi:hypothetical protein